MQQTSGHCLCAMCSNMLEILPVVWARCIAWKGACRRQDMTFTVCWRWSVRRFWHWPKLPEVCRSPHPSSLHTFYTFLRFFQNDSHPFFIEICIFLFTCQWHNIYIISMPTPLLERIVCCVHTWALIGIRTRGLQEKSLVWVILTFVFTLTASLGKLWINSCMCERLL